ncbi:MAG: THUMP domain-containing protein [Bacteroidales bacterium]|jgi:putative N6-adenine-specific DNA methylase|nr:THUMP domain-containing protein [Bacteroidales bacterium]
MNKDFKMVAKTMFGLEEPLAQELETLGANNIELMHRAVGFEGDMKMLYRANYCLRTALCVLKPIASFKASNPEELYQQVYNIKWEKHINPEGTLYIDSSIYSELFTHSLYASQKAKDAICDRLRKMFGIRPTVVREDADLRLNIRIFEDNVTLSLDSSGDSLFKRGYRTDTGEAPMNEVLASGLILLSKWNKDCNFYDPMCGSGTLLIEAAMYAMNIPAQYYRKGFAFQKWNDYSKPEFRKVKEQADAAMCDFDYQICGSDISKRAIAVATENIKNALLHKDISVCRKDILESTLPEGKTLIITNPPYGERLHVEDIIELYENMGNVFKGRYAGNAANGSHNEAWVISSDLFALKKIGLKPSKKITLYNGSLECRFCKFDLYHGSKKAKKQKRNFTEARQQLTMGNTPFPKDEPLQQGHQAYLRQREDR